MSRITESARGEQCQVRSKVCNYDNETTVFAHCNGAGMGRKDVVSGVDFGCYACSACHDLLDGRASPPAQRWEREQRELLHCKAVVRTFRILAEKGLLRP
jgi:hypothetical protein